LPETKHSGIRCSILLLRVIIKNVYGRPTKDEVKQLDDICMNSETDKASQINSD